MYLFNLTETTLLCPSYGEDLDVVCPESEVIVTTSASYGRMSITRCIELEDYIGCENDVMFLLDQWCSGRQTCQMDIPVLELKNANFACLSYLQMYLELKYHCLKGLLGACIIIWPVIFQ